MSPRSKAAYKWLSMIRKEEKILLRVPTPAPSLTLESPIGSHLALDIQVNRVEHVTDWELVAKKYRNLMGYTEDHKEYESTDEL